MNGYNDIATEPADDEEFAIAYGYEIITEEELLSLLTASMSIEGSSASMSRGYSIPTNKSTGSLASKSSGVSTMMSKPMSSCSLSSQGDMYEEDCSSSTSSGISEMHDDDLHEDDVDGHQQPVENLWYIIQNKRHIHDLEIEAEMRLVQHQFLTGEHTSHNSKLTEWFVNLLHFPEKIRQHAADKHRFNINKIPKEVRDELKHIYVY